MTYVMRQKSRNTRANSRALYQTEFADLASRDLWFSSRQPEPAKTITCGDIRLFKWHWAILPADGLSSLSSRLKAASTTIGYPQNDCKELPETGD
jgi:hypothetical protein